MIKQALFLVFILLASNMVLSMSLFLKQGIRPTKISRLAVNPEVGDLFSLEDVPFDTKGDELRRRVAEKLNLPVEIIRVHTSRIPEIYPDQTLLDLSIGEGDVIHANIDSKIFFKIGDEEMSVIIPRTSYVKELVAEASRKFPDKVFSDIEPATLYSEGKKVSFYTPLTTLLGDELKPEFRMNLELDVTMKLTFTLEEFGNQFRYFIKTHGKDSISTIKQLLSATTQLPVDSFILMTTNESTTLVEESTLFGLKIYRNSEYKIKVIQNVQYEYDIVGELGSELQSLDRGSTFSTINSYLKTQVNIRNQVNIQCEERSASTKEPSTMSSRLPLGNHHVITYQFTCTLALDNHLNVDSSVQQVACDAPIYKSLEKIGLKTNPQFYKIFIGEKEVDIRTGIIVKNPFGVQDDHLDIIYKATYIFELSYHGLTYKITMKDQTSLPNLNLGDIKRSFATEMGLNKLEDIEFRLSSESASRFINLTKYDESTILTSMISIPSDNTYIIRALDVFNIQVKDKFSTDSWMLRETEDVRTFEMLVHINEMILGKSLEDKFVADDTIEKSNDRLNSFMLKEGSFYTAFYEGTKLDTLTTLGTVQVHQGSTIELIKWYKVLFKIRPGFSMLNQDIPNYPLSGELSPAYFIRETEKKKRMSSRTSYTFIIDGKTIPSSDYDKTFAELGVRDNSVYEVQMKNT